MCYSDVISILTPSDFPLPGRMKQTTSWVPSSPLAVGGSGRNVRESVEEKVMVMIGSIADRMKCNDIAFNGIQNLL